MDTVTGNWIETYDHDKSLRLWVFLPDFGIMEDHRWRAPVCEIRQVG